MTIQEFKSQINQPSLMFARQLQTDPTDDTKSTPTSWLSHWDNEKRVRVIMHDDVNKVLKANPAFNGVAFKKNVVTPEGKEPYTRYILIVPKSVEAVY